MLYPIIYIFIILHTDNIKENTEMVDPGQRNRLGGVRRDGIVSGRLQLTRRAASPRPPDIHTNTTNFRTVILTSTRQTRTNGLQYYQRSQLEITHSINDCKRNSLLCATTSNCPLWTAIIVLYYFVLVMLLYASFV